MDKKQLTHALKVLKHSTVARSTIDCLQQVRLTQKAATLTLQTTNLDTVTKATLPHYAGGAEYDVLMGFKQLEAITKAAPAGDITLEYSAAGEFMAIYSDGRRVRVQLSEDKPAEVWPEPLEVDASLGTNVTREFFKALKTVSYAMSNEETRYYLNGVCLEREPDNSTLRLIATDGHRMQHITFINDDCTSPLQPIGKHSVGFNGEACIIPSATVKQWLALGIDNARLAASSDARRIELLANTGGIFYQIVSKLIDGNFPDWRRVSPDSSQKAAFSTTYSKKALIAAIKTLNSLSDERTRPLWFEFTASGDCTIANAMTSQPASASLDYSGEGYKIGFNGRYLLESVQAVDGEEVTLYFKRESNNSPIAIDGGGVLMPMRV